MLPAQSASPAQPGGAGVASGRPAPAAATWTAVVTTDRAYYDSVYAVNEQDTASIRASPANCQSAASR